MKVYYSIEEFKALDFAVVTTGTYDGVHLGHKTILNRLNKIAQESGGESVLLTFHPHPRQVLQPDVDIKLLNTQMEKIERLRETGLQHLIVQSFTKEFSRISSLDYVRGILVKQVGAKRLVIGYDHHFGRNREGSFEHLKEFGPVYGFTVEEIPAQELNEMAVSSTKIRKALSEGDVKAANRFLGYSYSLEGKVVRGNQIGATLGFATANIVVSDPNKLIPADGVYAVLVEWVSERGVFKKAMCNIGHRPTIGGQFRTMEVHIFDFDGDIYGEMLIVHFKHRLREERKFESLEELKKQLVTDKLEAKLNL